MIIKTKSTVRDLSVNETVVLAELQALDPNWVYEGITGEFKLFKLIIND